MSIMKLIQKGVKTRFSDKGRAKNSQQKKQNSSVKSKKKELYTDNEDLGFC